LVSVCIMYYKLTEGPNMSVSLLNVFPEEVVCKIVTNAADLSMRERLKKGWSLVHDEMMWRDTHHYSCTHHFCDVKECGCYRRFPGFLLRRVDAGVWLPGQGETREHEVVSPTTNGAGTHTRWEPDVEAQAIWIDFEANEIGMLNSMTPVVQSWHGFEEASHEDFVVAVHITIVDAALGHNLPA
jgi:hypothetical protein